jgi:hypothetical protein
MIIERNSRSSPFVVNASSLFIQLAQTTSTNYTERRKTMKEGRMVDILVCVNLGEGEIAFFKQKGMREEFFTS